MSQDVEESSFAHDPRAMRLRGASFSERWRYAAKLESWPKVLTPFLLGVSYSIAFDGELSWKQALGTLAWILGTILGIVWINDFSDREIDRVKRELYPKQCSPKVIPDRIIPVKQILVAGCLALLVALGGAYLAASDSSSFAFIIAALSSLMITTYSGPPFRLNYRGGGELVEAVGVGFFAPVSAFLLLTPSSVREEAFGYRAINEGFPSMLLWGGVLGFGSLALALSSAIASGLSDEASDRRGGKRTIASMYGFRVAGYSILSSLGIGTCCIAALAVFKGVMTEGWSRVFCLGYAMLVVVLLRSFWQCLTIFAEASSMDFFQINRLKKSLHGGIWLTYLGLALLKLLHS